MERYVFALHLYTVLLLAACRPTPETLPWPTKVCVKTTHHGQAIPDATVYVKLNADSFPGYDKQPTYYDMQFKTGKNAYGCIESLPEGRHWLVAFGYDSLHYPHDVFGSLPVTISLDRSPVVDTILYVSEKH